MHLRCLLLLLCYSLLSACADNSSKHELDQLKLQLFKPGADVSGLPIYADPPTQDYLEFNKGGFRFQLDSSAIRNIQKYSSELEPMIVQRIDSGFSWVYLAAFLRYDSALPKLKEKLLNCNFFYGWEGGDYSDIDRFLSDEQYCYQSAYIAAIEHISNKPLSKSIQLSNSEQAELESNARKCNENNRDSLELYCPARWLLSKIQR